jgi:hypothetical protein
MNTDVWTLFYFERIARDEMGRIRSLVHGWGQAGGCLGDHTNRWIVGNSWNSRLIACNDMGAHSAYGLVMQRPRLLAPTRTRHESALTV